MSGPGLGAPAAPAVFNLESQRERGWLERSALCARMVAGLVAADPGLARLADIGCGDGKLQRSLAARSVPVTYAGFDLLPQRPAIRRFDLTIDSLSEPYDIVVMLGVTEYLPDFLGTLRRLWPSCRHLIFSHVLRTAKPPSDERLAELGWVNHLDDQQLSEVVAAAGYRIRDRATTPDGKTRLLACQTGPIHQREPTCTD